MTKEECEALLDESEVISIYTRKQALDDGVLIDVSEMAKEAGFKVPVAVTTGVLNEVIVPNPLAAEMGQSEEGRMWDVLWMARRAVTRLNRDKNTIHYRILVFDPPKHDYVDLKMAIGPGDHFEPVITIMMPYED